MRLPEVGRDIGVPLIAAAATVLLTAGVSRSFPVALLFGGFMPLLVGAGWCTGSLLAPGPSRFIAMAVGTVLLCAMIEPAMAPSIAAYIAAGLIAGWALSGNWSWDRRVALVALPLLMVTIYQISDVDIVEVLDQTTAENIAELRSNPPSGTDEAALEALFHELERGREIMLELVRRVWTGTVVLAELATAGLIVLLGSFLGRRLSRREDIARVPGFTRWSVPGYLVWVAAAGLLLVLLRQDRVIGIGENLVWVSGALFGLQGLAIKGFLVGRFLSWWQQSIFWGVFGFLLAPITGPLLLFGGIVLGILDQWIDLRGMVENAEMRKK